MLPAESVAVQETVVVPMGKVEPEGGSQLTVRLLSQLWAASTE
jgi:hypothetical protein